MFPGAACIVSLVDRLVHNAEVVAIDGDSYRLKEATERADLDAFFSIGFDVGRAVGRALGEDPAVFNLWGEAVRAAELMAQTAPDPGTIQVTEGAYAILRSRFLLRQRGRFYMPRTGVSASFVLAGPR